MATVEVLASEFEQLHTNLIEILELIPEDRLYWEPFQSGEFLKILSCGDLISHIGGTVEYAFNGITSNFWEEPFEWITREVLPTRAHVAGYLQETAAVVRHAFGRLTDEDLSKRIYFPDATATTIGEMLITTLTHACHHRGQVYAYIHLFSPRRLPATGRRARFDINNP